MYVKYLDNGAVCSVTFKSPNTNLNKVVDAFCATFPSTEFVQDALISVLAGESMLQVFKAAVVSHENAGEYTYRPWRDFGDVTMTSYGDIEVKSVTSGRTLTINKSRQEISVYFGESGSIDAAKTFFEYLAGDVPPQLLAASAVQKVAWVVMEDAKKDDLYDKAVVELRNQGYRYLVREQTGGDPLLKPRYMVDEGDDVLLSL